MNMASGGRTQFFLIQLCALVLNSVCTELCQKGTTVGDPDFKKHSDNMDELSGVLYLASSDLYRFQCCGLIHAVKTHTLKNGEVRFIVWRPTDVKDRYMVAGDFKIEVTNAPHAGSILPSGTLQMQVQPDDLIGWYNSDVASIPYVDGDVDGHVYILPVDGEPSLGDIVDFKAATKESGRIYAVGANVEEDLNIPEFKGTPEAVQISADAEVGTVIAQVKVFDPQLQDAVITISDNPYFVVHQSGRSISLKATTVPGVYDLVLTSTSLCGLSATFTMTVTVNEASTPGSNTEALTTVNSGPEPSTADLGPVEISPTPGTDQANSATTKPESANSTVEMHILTPNESQSDLWKVLAGLAASIVLVSCVAVILRYAWKIYGGKRKPKVATDTLKVPDKTEKDPESLDSKQEAPPK